MPKHRIALATTHDETFVEQARWWWRVDSGLFGRSTFTGADIVQYEECELGNATGVARALLPYLATLTGYHVLWAGPTHKSVARYGPRAQHERIYGVAVGTDGDDGYLIVQVDAHDKGK